jgi:hypothetical protein
MDIRDAAFGYGEDVLDLVNMHLHPAGLHVERLEKARRNSR